MREYTLSEFKKNLVRVNNLIAVYEHLQRERRGRRSVQSADTLRAAVVFMHSALEEVFRNLFLWRLPLAEPETLDEIPLVGASPTHRATPFLLGKLVPHGGLFVHNVIRESIKAYVDHMNINNTKELCHCIVMISLAPKDFGTYFSSLDEAMQRRHQIVHQMDRNREHGKGAHRAQSISVRQVLKWQANLDAFTQSIVGSIPD